MSLPAFAYHFGTFVLAEPSFARGANRAASSLREALKPQEPRMLAAFIIVFREVLERV